MRRNRAFLVFVTYINGSMSTLDFLGVNKADVFRQFADTAHANDLASKIEILQIPMRASRLRGKSQWVGLPEEN